MPRVDIFKKIKDDVLIEDRIQIIRLHYNYLKTCLKHPKEFQVSKSAYAKWDLPMVKSVSFDTWWKRLGSKILGKKLSPPRIVRTNPKIKDNSILIEVSADNPTEYSVSKIRELLQSKGKSKDTDQRNHHVKLEIYLEAWNLKRDMKMTLKEVRRRLIAKRKILVATRMGKSFIAKKGKTVAMPREKVENFLKYDPSNENASLRNLERQVSRYKRNAQIILENVCRGDFPGQYTS